ncbi:MAG: hypothetical protein BGO78_13475 [Chloroflexi bacterium 44-23]|nr:MAG: hypothetical protein BGO78_13475 [Chloroflexi bacterium 44-23]
MESERNSLRVLFVVPYQPDLIRVRPYQLIRHLAKAGHTISLIYYDSPEKVEPTNELLEICEHVYSYPLTKMRALRNSLAAIPTRQPIQLRYGFLPQMFQKICSLVLDQENHFDIIHFEHIRSAIYALRLMENHPDQGYTLIWDSVDSITHLFTQAASQHPRWLVRQIMKEETRRTANFEPNAASKFKRVLVTSSKDQQIFVKLQSERGLDKNISVLPNGVDLKYFLPNPAIERDPNTLVISGKMSYHANERMVIRFVEEILPLIWQEIPETRLWVVGQNPSSRVIELGHENRIMITGWVKDIRPFLQGAAIAVAPLTYGAGIQNKILEAMACETPVIATSIATQALQIKNGENILVADENEAFSKLVIKLLRDNSLRQKIGIAGRKYVEHHHSWKEIAYQLEDLYRQSA